MAGSDDTPTFLSGKFKGKISLTVHMLQLLVRNLIRTVLKFHK